MLHKEKQRLLKEAMTEMEWEINRISRLSSIILSMPIGLIAQAFPIAKFVKNSFSIDIVMPMSFPLIQEVREFMAMQFPDYKLTYDHQIVSGSYAFHTLTYDIPDVGRFDIYFKMSEKGSTCVLNPIGTETVEKTVYEVVCSQAAADEFTIKDV